MKLELIALPAGTSCPIAASVSITVMAALAALVLMVEAVALSHRWNTPLPDRTAVCSLEIDIRPTVSSNAMLGSSAPNVTNGK